MASSFLKERSEPPYGYELNALSEYASTRRYEEGNWTPTEDELNEVIKKTKDMLDWAKKQIR